MDGFSALLEDSAEDLYDNAPCGYLSTLLDGEIAKVNQTLLTWLGYRREDLVGRRRFVDLLSPGGRLYHETHYAPLLRMQGGVREIALDLVAADGARLPVLVTSAVKVDPQGHPQLIRTTVFDARHRRAYERELLRARHAADRERERLQRLATTLQRTLLPPSLPTVPGMRVAANYHIASTEEVSGDFYDLFPLGGGRWGFFLGDVCGKGAPAAVLTSLTRYTLRAAAVHNADPVAVLSDVDTVLRQEYQEDGPRHCTVVFGVLTADRDGFEVTLGSGGHPPALAVRGHGGVDVLRTPGGQILGLLRNPRFVATSTRLEPGDALLLYTDGLTEARRPDGGLVGEEKLLQMTVDLAGADARTIVAALSDHLAGLGGPTSDDVALLALSVPARDRPPTPA